MPVMGTMPSIVCFFSSARISSAVFLRDSSGAFGSVALGGVAPELCGVVVF